MSTISGRYDLVDGTPARRDGSPKASWSAWPLPSRPARYESRCPVCDGDIEIGSTIWHTTEERWVCGACADHQPREVWS